MTYKPIILSLALMEVGYRLFVRKWLRERLGF
jgi:hypothetical protein